MNRKIFFSEKKNILLIKELAQKNGNILNRSSLISMVAYLNESDLVYDLNVNYLKNKLIDLQLFEEIKIIHKANIITRLVPKYIKISPNEIALSLAGKKAHLSHLSALSINQLTNIIPKNIYVNEEQTKKNINKKNAILTQNKVNNAFLKPVRKTNNTAMFSYKSKRYLVTFLNGKNTNYIGVENVIRDGYSKPVRVSGLERSLMESIIRPNYSGGLENVMDAFENGKEIPISLNKLSALFIKGEYIYPYLNAVLFFAKETGYNTDILKNKMNTDYYKYNSENIILPLDHQLIEPQIDSIARVYYPKKLIN